MINGDLIYADMKKVAELLAPAGIQFPLAAKKGNLINYSIKTEEDLVKFKLQKEEEYKAAAAHEATNEKDSSLQTQPADKSRLQPRGTASYEPMVTDSITEVNKEEAKMTTENQARKESPSYADSYHQELADVCAASKESFTDLQNEKLKESADRLYKQLLSLEESEGVCGPEQDAWDGFAPLHEKNISNIFAAKDISEATGKESQATEEAVTGAVHGIEDSAAYMGQCHTALLQKQKDYEEQIDGLRRRVEELEQAKKFGVGTAQDFAQAITVATDFLHQVENIRKDAASQSRKRASDMFDEVRKRTADVYYTVKFAPTQIKAYIADKAHKAVDRVLRKVASAFEQGSQALAEAQGSILSRTQESQSAAEFYREALKEEAKANDGKLSLETDARVALSMAKAGMGAYTIRMTLERESPFRKEMKNGKAEEIAKEAKAKVAAERETEQEENLRR